VCDQPLLTPAHLKKMIKNHITQKSPIVASFYSGSPGVPVLFHRSLVKELLDLNDEYGAKRIVQDRRELTSFIEFPEGAIDLDTPDDWKKFHQV
jgi:molybdenum cofactor cytidylyltransferase